MSGGSLGYLYTRVEDAAEEVRGRARTALQRAFAEHLHKVAKALHDVEWLYSGDYGEGDEVAALEAVITPEFRLDCLVKEADRLTLDMKVLIIKAGY
jgi:hypothetical protein